MRGQTSKKIADKNAFMKQIVSGGQFEEPKPTKDKGPGVRKVIH